MDGFFCNSHGLLEHVLNIISIHILQNEEKQVWQWWKSIRISKYHSFQDVRVVVSHTCVFVYSTHEYGFGVLCLVKTSGIYYKLLA